MNELSVVLRQASQAALWCMVAWCVSRRHGACCAKRSRRKPSVFAVAPSAAIRTRGRSPNAQTGVRARWHPGQASAATGGLMLATAALRAQSSVTKPRRRSTPRRVTSSGSCGCAGAAEPPFSAVERELASAADATTTLSSTVPASRTPRFVTRSTAHGGENIGRSQRSSRHRPQ